MPKAKLGGLARSLARALPLKYLGALSHVAYRGTRSFSGSAEDIIIGDFFTELRPVARGRYVDIGAFHPKVVSNTYKLHRAGWTGVNIDVDAHKIAVFDMFRPRDINVCVAVSDARGTAEFFFHDAHTYGSMAGLDREGVAQTAQKQGRPLASRRVETVPLSELLEEKGISQFDFLNIDIEGHEYPVLKAFALARFGVSLVAVEIRGDWDAVTASPTFRLLEDQGYRLHAWTPPTLFFAVKTP